MRFSQFKTGQLYLNFIAVRSVKFTNKGEEKLQERDVKYFTFNSFKDILSDNDINTIDTNAKTKTEDRGSMTRATKMSCCPLYHRVGRNVGATWLMVANTPA